MNLWIENYLKEFINGRQDNWSTLLPIAEFAHNSWKHEHTKYTPHQLILGINPTTNLSIPDDENPNAQQRLMQLSKAQQDAQRVTVRSLCLSVVLVLEFLDRGISRIGSRPDVSVRKSS